ncbi:hypothetical protein ACOSQ2_019337 [Xanthoceras sorbifolium]
MKPKPLKKSKTTQTSKSTKLPNKTENHPNPLKKKNPKPPSKSQNHPNPPNSKPPKPKKKKIQTHQIHPKPPKISSPLLSSSCCYKHPKNLSKHLSLFSKICRHNTTKIYRKKRSPEMERK